MSYNRDTKTISSGNGNGVSVYDVQQALVEYDTNDVATLCESQEVNPWARHKPIYVPNPNMDATKTIGGVACALMPKIADEVQKASGYGVRLLGEYYDPNNENGGAVVELQVIRRLNGCVRGETDASLWQTEVGNDAVQKAAEKGLRPYVWAESAWHNLGDFDGYKHDAQLVLPIINLGGNKTQSPQPTFPEDKRNIVVRSEQTGAYGQRFQIPDEEAMLTKWGSDGADAIAQSQQAELDSQLSLLELMDNEACQPVTGGDNNHTPSALGATSYRMLLMMPVGRNAQASEGWEECVGCDDSCYTSGDVKAPRPDYYSELRYIKVYSWPADANGKRSGTLTFGGGVIDFASNALIQQGPTTGSDVSLATVVNHLNRSGDENPITKWNQLNGEFVVAEFYCTANSYARVIPSFIYRIKVSRNIMYVVGVLSQGDLVDIGYYLDEGRVEIAVNLQTDAAGNFLANTNYKSSGIKVNFLLMANASAPYGAEVSSCRGVDAKGANNAIVATCTVSPSGDIVPPIPMPFADYTIVCEVEVEDSGGTRCKTLMWRRLEKNDSDEAVYATELL